MCSRLGSELPIPLSVISEQNLIHFLDSTDAVSGDLECSSSDAPKSSRNHDEIEIAYEKQLVNLINQMLDIDCTSNLVYIDHKSDARIRRHWRSLMENRFCLLKPINHVSCLSDEDRDKNNGPYQNDRLFSENFLNKVNKISNPTSKFDLIIMKNCIQNFNNPSDIITTLFDDFMVQSVDSGTILIIQRSYQYNCLPFYDSLDKLWMQNDFSINNFIDSLKVHKLEITTSIEEIDCNMSKMNWLLSLNRNQIYPLDFFNNKKLLSENVEDTNNDGVRQVCEGIFKYGSDAVTFDNKDKGGEAMSYGDEKNNYIFKDRLVFLTIKRSNKYFQLQKFKKRYLYEEKSKFRNVKHIQDTMSDYFEKEDAKIKRREDFKRKETGQKIEIKNVSVEDDVMNLLFEIDPSLKNKVPYV
jgi:hypothetical protein